MSNVILANEADPIADGEACEKVIAEAGWFRNIGETPRWPLGTGDVVRMLSGAGYAIDEDGVNELIRRRLFTSPCVEGDSLEFSAVDVVKLSGLLEARQAWLPTPNKTHDPKKSETQILLEQCREDGTVGQIGNHPGRPVFDLTHLLILIEKCENYHMRAKLVSHLKATLETEFGVYLI